MIRITELETDRIGLENKLVKMECEMETEEVIQSNITNSLRY